MVGNRTEITETSEEATQRSRLKMMKAAAARDQWNGAERVDRKRVLPRRV